MHELQQKLVDWRQRKLVDDMLLLLEHSPVITLGRRADEAHILASQEVLNREGIARNLATYGLFAGTERLLMELVKVGADRQAMHEVIREHSMRAWEAIRAGQANPLTDLLAGDPRLGAYLPTAEISSLLDAASYVGDAPQRARALAQQIRQQV